MQTRWVLVCAVLVAVVVGGVHAGTKPRRARRHRPLFQNFTGAEPVIEVPLLNYEWNELEESMEVLLEAALGPEVAYWKTRGITCEDIAHTVKELHGIFLHSVRVVLIRNQTWHFLDPAETRKHGGQQEGGGDGDRGGGVPGRRAKAAADAGSRFDWPPLVPNPPDTCSSPCQAQLKIIHEAIASRLAGWGSRRPREGLPPRYGLPDMVFVINAADNMQRFGSGSRAPLLSLMKWWRVPWTAPEQRGAGTAAAGAKASASGGTDSTGTGGGVSLGRVDGKLLQPMSLPSSVARRKTAAAVTTTATGGGRGLTATGGGGDDAAGGAARGEAVAESDPLWGLVRRFVVGRSKELPPGVEVRPRRQRGRSGGGGGEGDDDGGEEDYETAAEARTREYDLDLMLPTMAFAPRSLSYFPWEQKKDIAFFRGVGFCPLYVAPDLAPVCPRALLANATAAGWFPGDLDVRLVRKFRGRLGSKEPYRQTVELRGVLPTTPRDHSRYRYLLHMDGLAGSTRLGVLMATDSLILKSRSPFIEYFSRLQVPGAHYLEFWKDPADPWDVLSVLRQARQATAADPQAARAAAEANQAIAARYIAMEPKLAYARAALLAYHMLVPSMSECVEDLVGHLERSGHHLPYRRPRPLLRPLTSRTSQQGQS